MPNLCCCVAPKPPGMGEGEGKEDKDWGKEKGKALLKSLKTNSAYPSRFSQCIAPEQLKELEKIATAIVAPGKGILASDESVGTMHKRLSSIHLANTVENRRKYRELLFTTDRSLAKYISSVILFEETYRQKTESGVPFVKVLIGNGIIVGIKVDKGVCPLAGTHNECTTQGLDGLAERLEEYKKGGCSFAKWRSVLKVSECTPSQQAIVENAHTVARFASICQHAGLVPIIEPEVLPDGSHDLETTQRVTEEVLAHQFKALLDHHVHLEGALLKVNMVTAGKDSPLTYSHNNVGKATIQTLRRRVPTAIAGVTFLSGGQSEAHTTINLNEINLCKGHKPCWSLTFSYGRALQASVLKAWGGQDKNVKAGQQALLHRAEENSLASKGNLDPSRTAPSHARYKTEFINL